MTTASKLFIGVIAALENPLDRLDNVGALDELVSDGATRIRLVSQCDVAPWLGLVGDTAKTVGVVAAAVTASAELVEAGLQSGFAGLAVLVVDIATVGEELSLNARGGKESGGEGDDLHLDVLRVASSGDVAEDECEREKLDIEVP